MKKILLITTLSAGIFCSNANAFEKYGNTLNVGVGIGGYSGDGNAMRSLPVLHVNYEFDVIKNFTLAPFASFYTFSNNYFWGNNNFHYQDYSYRETVIPIGVKGTYYFDDLLKAGIKWDFYLAGSFGYAIVNTKWQDDYNGDRNHFNSSSSLFLDAHIGAEYHINNRLGAFVDLSSGVSTIGLTIH